MLSNLRLNIGCPHGNYTTQNFAKGRFHVKAPYRNSLKTYISLKTALILNWSSAFNCRLNEEHFKGGGGNKFLNFDQYLNFLKTSENVSCNP